MDLIKDALNNLFDIYFKIEGHDDWEYNYKKDKYFPNIEVIDEIKQKILYDAKDDYFEYSNFVSLLALEYCFILQHYNKQNEERLYNNEIVFDMLNMHKQDFLDSMYFDENNYLIQIIFQIITKYNPKDYIDEYCYKPILEEKFLQHIREHKKMKSLIEQSLKE